MRWPKRCEDWLAGDNSAPVRILSAGMVGSGSTFLYNVIREILETDSSLRTLATYSDEWNPAFAGNCHLVIKSHWGIRALFPLAERGLLLPIVSVRHPGDAVCSDRERFGFAFDFALHRVALSLKFCGLLRRLPDTLLLRYEDRFASSPRTAPVIADLLGVRMEADALTEVARKYGAAATRNYAAGLTMLPNLMRSADNPGDVWCPKTQIHRGHIGKMTVGRWRDLPADERRQIDDLCGEEAASFGYDCAR
jgi:hypothetical protein